MSSVVVRFAPSPTGPLHIGGVRTALYNYLFARQQGGKLLLRIEDTDQTRYVEGAEEYIMQSLRWLGIEFDEGVAEGGPHAPYRQSERAAQGLYQQYADQLIESGWGYYAFDSAEDLEAMRERLKEEGSSIQQYNYLTRASMSNSYSLSPEEVAARIASGAPYVIRFNMPADQDIAFSDLVRDTVSFHSSQLDDKVLLKSDGFPTYHLANVVDDHLMQVTHVIRGEEWLSSTPLHVMLYQALGWQDTMPAFVHLPLILNPNGKGKMSKRTGDKLGFSVFPTSWTDPETGSRSIGYCEQGYLPGAMVNFLALLGWNPGDEEEIMSLARLSERFSLSRIHSAPTHFNLDKLRWFNEQYLREHSDDEDLLPLIKIAVAEAGYGERDEVFLRGIIALMKERVSLAPEFVTQAPYLFEAPSTYDEKMRSKQWKADTPALIEQMIEAFEGLSETSWQAAQLEATFEGLVARLEIGKGRIMAPLRLALTGMGAGPGVFDIAALIGREETLGRLRHAIQRLS